MCQDLEEDSPPPPPPPSPFSDGLLSLVAVDTIANTPNINININSNSNSKSNSTSSSTSCSGSGRDGGIVDGGGGIVSLNNPNLPTPQQPAAKTVLSSITAVAGAAVYSRRMSLTHHRKKKLPYLTKKKWESAFNSETGQLHNARKILKRIRKGGIDPAIRAEVWPFLLGLYDLESTLEERASEAARQREGYENLRQQCFLMHSLNFEVAEAMLKEYALDVPPANSNETSFEAISKDSSSGSNISISLGSSSSSISSISSSSSSSGEQAEEGFGVWQRIIRMDAVRMGTEWASFSPSQASVLNETANKLATYVGLSDDDEVELEPFRRHHAARLVAILEAYSLHDPETGYCQGMSDLLSPFVALLEEDYAAFWCFAHFMQTARQNFRLDEEGILRQLAKVSKILELGDPDLFRHLEQIEAEACFFVYRMVMVLLRRELSFEQTISLWEVTWADCLMVRSGNVKPPSSWRRKGRKKASPTNDLLLYVIAAVICQRRSFILQKCGSMDDIIRECNGLAGHLDIWLLLEDARGLVVALHDKIEG